MTVVAALASHGGCLFLARRAPGLRDGGLWELPGGKVEAGESPAEALHREIREELSVGMRILGDATGYRFIRSDGILHFLVFPVSFEGEPVAGVAHDRTAWVEPESLAGYPLAPLDAEPVAKWASRIAAASPSSRE